MKQLLKYLFIILLTLTSVSSNAQCWVSLLADSLDTDTVRVCSGDSVTLQLEGECILLYNDFNDNGIGTGWSHVTPGLMMNSPCDTISIVKCAWFGESTQIQRVMETIDLDLSPGGEVSFDLKFGIQGDPPPCEGPDEMMEGVSLQYSVDQGQTWIDITYFCPDGTFLPTNPMVQYPMTYTPTQFTEWENYTFIVPPDAQTPNTRFRWLQSYCSFFSNEYYDNWGLDNVKITRSINQFLHWSTGNNTLGPVTVCPNTTTTYSVYILGGNIPPDTLAIDQVVVFVYPSPQAQLSGDLEICTGESTLLEASGPYTFQWSDGTNGSTIAVAPLVTSTYFVTPTDINGCKGLDSVTVVVHPLPQLTMINDTICSGEQGMISASGGISYLWNTGETSPQILIQPEVTTSYTVTVTDQNGCINQGISYVFVNPLPSVFLTPDTSVCYGDRISLSAVGGVKYYWNTGAQTSIITVTPLQHTTYTVTIVDNEGCQNDANVTVFVSPEYQPVILSDLDTICRGEEAILTAAGGTGYTWSTGATSESITVVPPFTNYYAVTVTNYFNGLLCPSEALFLLNVKECSTIFFPNAFSPKGYNPEFKAIGDFTALYNYSLQIFDRWGKLLFESNHPDQGWNGQLNGEYLPAGVYTYRVTYTKSLLEESFEKVGAVILVE